MDLVAGGKKVIVLMEHNSKDGSSKIVENCSLPLTGKGVVNKIITNLGVFEVNNGIHLIELADNVTKEDILEKTDTDVKFSS